MDWRAVWEKKGTLDTQDLVELDGFEKTSIQPRDVAGQIKKLLEIADDEIVVEVGCGAGMIARYMTCRYLGIDYSRPLLNKMKKILGREVLNAEAIHIPLKDKSVDKIYVFSVFHYFPNLPYAQRVVDELKRVARKGIFVGDLPIRSHSPDHLLYVESFFSGWTISSGFYNSDRFNACLKLS
jgi:SAM-dependent methyltransferase